jgi:HemY protein
LLEGRLTQRVATLMARIEGEQHGDAGRVREWLARAVNAPRDPAWIADGVVSDRWTPVSPVTGALDAFHWRVPVEAVGSPAGALLAVKAEAFSSQVSRPDAALPRPAPTRNVAPAAEPAETIEWQAPSTGIGDAAVQGKPVSPARASAPAEAGSPAAGRAMPIAARAATDSDGEDDLRERIRQAAQRGVATSEAGGAPAAPSKSAAPAAKPNATKGGARGPGPKPETAPRAAKPAPPKIFIAPRAPDDPGPESLEEGRLDIAPLRPSGAKA